MIAKSLLIFGVFSAISANAQIFSVGVLGGAPFTDVVKATTQNDITYASNSANFTVGPAVQINLPFSLRFEFDALYRPYSFTTACAIRPNVTCPVSSKVSADQWSFPFLAQYRFKAPIVKPFVEAGVSFDHLASISSAANAIASGSGHLVQQSHASLVLGGGVDVKVPFIRVSGELRYIHQGSADFQSISNLNQAEVLFGIHF